MLDKIQRIDINSSDYPRRLREIPDPPEKLYCAGDISLLNADSISVVGSRKYTLYGKTVAHMIGKRLGECGVPVVSGLAYGIDAFAHQGALDAGGKVIGVLPGGLHNMAPAGNKSLMERGLASGGLMISEYEPDDHAEKWKYPRRNRIISGLGRLTAVVEASMNSGSLITAQHAGEQGSCLRLDTPMPTSLPECDWQAAQMCQLQIWNQSRVSISCVYRGPPLRTSCLQRQCLRPAHRHYTAHSTDHRGFSIRFHCHSRPKAQAGKNRARLLFYVPFPMHRDFSGHRYAAADSCMLSAQYVLPPGFSAVSHLPPAENRNAFLNNDCMPIP